MRGLIVGLGLLVAVLGWSQPRLRLETGIGHTETIWSATLSSDGRRAMTASVDGTARLWDVGTGREVRRFNGHSDAVRSATFATDSKTVLTASDDGTARLWDVATGAEVGKFVINPGSILSAVFSPDGEAVLAACSDKTTWLWDIASGKEIRRFKGHQDAVSSAVFSADGKSVLTASHDGTARLWDAATGRETRRLEGQKGALNCAVFSADGRSVVTASNDGTARLWDVATGRQTRRLEGHDRAVTSAAFSIDGRSVVTASDDGTARLWDVATGKEIQCIVEGDEPVCCASFTPDGKAVFTLGIDGTERLRLITTGKEIQRTLGSGEPVFCAIFSPDGTRVLAATGDKTVRLWATATGMEPRPFEGHEGTVRSVSFSSDGRFILTASDDRTARIWDCSSRQEVHRFEGHEMQVMSAVFSSDGYRVLTASMDRTSRLWEIATGKEILRIVGHQDWVNSARFSPDGKSILTASRDGTARLWELATGQERRRYEGHGNAVLCATFSGDGELVLTAGADKTARLWNAGSAKELRRFEGHRSSLWDAAFAPDDRTVLTASLDGTTRLWDVASGKETRRLEGQGFQPATAVFSYDGTSVLTASFDGTSRLWDTATGKELCALISYRDGSWSVVDPEGRYDSSDGGQNPNLYWVYEDAAKGILDTIGVDQIGSYFYTPGLLAKVMKREKLPPVEKLDTLPIFPRVEDVKVEGRGSKVEFVLTDRGGGIGEVRAFVGGQLVKTVQGKPGKNTVDLGEAGGDVQIVAYNRTNTLASPRSTATVPPPGAPTTPTRYVAVIAGIEAYAGPGLKPLSYAADDAVAIARSILACAQGLKITPEVYVLSSSPEAQALKKEGVTVLPGTKAQFREVFTKILPAGGKWRDSDLMFLYLSGHGTTYKDGNLSHYAYYTEDARDADLGLKRDAWAVTDVELVQWLAAFPGGKRAMVLDTCAAGAATELLAQARDDADRERAMLDTNRNTGMSVLFGSADNAASWEANGHGLLTYSLLQLLATEPNLGGDLKDAVRVDTLFSRAEAETRREAERLGLKQEPRKFGRGQDFPIGFLDEGGRKKVPYASPVPVFAAPRVLNTASLADDLKLSEAIGAALSDLGKKGEGPSPIRYVPTSTAGVLIQGGYSVTGDKVTLKLNLTPPGKARIDLPPIEGTLAEVVTKAAAAIADWARANPR